MGGQLPIVPIVIGCIFFGVAMGCRDFVDSIWICAAVAGIGGVGLFVAMAFARKMGSGKRTA